MRVFKIFLIALFLLMSGILYASTPEEAVNFTLEAIKSKDFELYSKYVDLSTMVLFKGFRSKSLEKSSDYIKSENNFDSMLSLYQKQLKEDTYFYSFSMLVFRTLLKKDISKNIAKKEEDIIVEDFSNFLRKHFKDISTIGDKVVKITDVKDFDVKKDYYILMTGLSRMFLMYISLENNEVGLTDGRVVKLEIVDKDVISEEKVYLCPIDGEWKVFGSEKGLIPMIPTVENAKRTLLQMQRQYFTGMNKGSKLDLEFTVSIDGETNLRSMSLVQERRSWIKIIGSVFGMVAFLWVLSL